MKIKIIKLTLLLVIFTTTNLFSKVIPFDISKLPVTSQKVFVGIYLMNVYEIEMTENSYYADFYLWMKWKGDIDPFKNMEFVNYIEKWDFHKEMIYDTTQLLSDGYFYNAMRLEGRFYHAFSLNRFPLDKQILDIQIENSDYTIEDLVYLAGDEISNYRPELLLPGWNIKESKMIEQVNIYDTNFGTPEVEKEEYSNLEFRLAIERPVSFFAWKLLLPLIVVLISSLGTMLIFPGFVDARISLPTGALLAAVFLQQSYTSGIPNISYMVLMDKVYVLSYILIIANLVQAIITANKFNSDGKNSYIRIKKFDYKYVAISLTIFIIAILSIILT